MKFPDSALAHKLLDGKRGIEIGPSAHNPFNLCTVNVGHDTAGSVYEKEERDLCGEVARIHFVCDAWDLPFKDNTCDFVLASHVLEHCYDVIGTINEWLRVVKPGGLVFIIFPHKDRMFDKDRPRTTLAELQARVGQKSDKDEHHTVWVTQDAQELVSACGWDAIEWQDADDKVGNGFTFVLKKKS